MLVVSVVSVTSVVVASMVVAVVVPLVFALVIVILVLALVVVVGPCGRAGLSEVQREGHELPYER